MSRLWFFLTVSFVLCTGSIGSAAAQALGNVPTYATESTVMATRPGSYLRTVHWRTASRADGAGVALLMFAGGSGMLRLAANGAVGGLTQNFLVRSREQFLEAGIDWLTASDAPSDRQQGMNGSFRLSATHADDMARVVDEVRARSRLPVWLIGTSAGTLSAASVATRLGNSSSEVDGLVLTSPVTSAGVEGRCGRTMLDANLEFFRRPVLIVAHSQDACHCSPPDGAPAALARFINAPKKELKIFSGGLPALSRACEARSPHGFYGLEEEVARFVVDWIKAAK